MQGGISIPDNSDLNDYIKPGNYYCNSSLSAGTISNNPFDGIAFVLKVSYSTGNDGTYIMQTIQRYTDGVIQKRVRMAGSWTEWKTFSDDATVLATAQKSSPPIRTFNNEEDIDNYLDNFSNSFAENVHYYTAISLTIMHSQLGGGAHLIEGYKTSNSYEWQQATTYSSPNGCYRRARSKAGGVWGEWVLFKNS